MIRVRMLPKGITKSKLFHNYVYLSTYQVVNFLVPLIIIPFVIKYTGVNNYGKIAFSYAFVNYFIVLTDYGFNMSTTRTVSINRNSMKKVSEIYSTVMVIKLLFCVAAFLIFSCLLLIPFFQKNYLLHLLSFTLVIAQVLTPVWLFQGLEEMKYLAIANTISKVFFAIFIIILIKKPSDYLYVNFLQGLGGIIAAIVCNIIVLTKLNIKFTQVSTNEIVHEIKDGWVLFLSSLAVSIYVISNAFILGLFASPLLLGYYSVAERVYFALKQFCTVFSQVVYPKVCILANQSLYTLKKFQRKVFFPFFLFLLLNCIVIFFLAPFICHYFLKQYNSYEVILIRTFCVVPLIVAFDIPSFQALLALNKKKYYGSILISGCFFNVAFNLLLANFLGAMGTVISVLLTELYITICLIISFNNISSINKPADQPSQ